MDELAHVIGGRNYRVSRHLTVYTPRIHEIMEFGETLYFQVLNLFTRKPYDIAVELSDNGIDYQELTDYDLWLAEYDSKPDFYYHFDLWQYSHTGQVAGIEGNVDLDLDLR